MSTRSVTPPVEAGLFAAEGADKQSTGALTGKTALVTGASRGIGRAVALMLAAQGARVVGTATTENGVSNLRAALAPLGGSAMLLDVNDAPRCESVMEDVLKRFGGLSILVNNAGITRDTLAMRMKDDDWGAVIETNLNAVFRLSRSAIRPMMKAREGRIINITSVVASMGNAGQANYAAAKAGVGGMTRALARELGSRGITVNCVAPGFIDTDMTRGLNDAQTASLIQQIPLGRLGQPEEVAGVVAFLAGPAAAYVTGTTLHVNGGMYMNT